MITFFDGAPVNGTKLPDEAELRARISAPVGFEGCVVVSVGDLLVWRRRTDLCDDDLINFYDGDCRNVLPPDDPRVIEAEKALHA